MKKLLLNLGGLVVVSMGMYEEMIYEEANAYPKDGKASDYYEVVPNDPYLKKEGRKRFSKKRAHKKQNHGKVRSWVKKGRAHE